MALEQVRLAGGKRLEVNTYENCKQTAYRRLRKQSRVENEIVLPVLDQQLVKMQVKIIQNQLCDDKNVHAVQSQLEED